MTEQQTTARRLVRRTDDRVVGGVASGLADYLAIDPIIVRVAFVVLAAFNGGGVVAYAALWLLVPEDTQHAPARMRDRERDPLFWVGIGLLILAALAVAAMASNQWLLWPLVLIGAGIALWRSDDIRVLASRMQSNSTTKTPSTTTTAPMAAPAATVVEDDLTGAPTDDWEPGDPLGEMTERIPVAPPPPPPPSLPPAPPAPKPAPKRARERPPFSLGAATFGTLLLVLAGYLVLDRSGAVDLTFHGVMAVSMVVVGAGLLVGTWVGRARWMIVPTIFLLLPGLFLSSLFADFGLRLDTGWGPLEVTVDHVDDLEPLYEVGLGNVELDLRNLDLEGGIHDVEAAVGFGNVLVIVPTDVDVHLSWVLAAGRVSAWDLDRAGTQLRGETVLTASVSPGTGQLNLTLRGIGGELEVIRRDPAPRTRTDAFRPTDLEIAA